MEQQQNYNHLQELSNSDFQIVPGEPNIFNWKVKNEHGTFVGEVKDLLFDVETNAVRYLIIDLTDNGMQLGNKKVMIPIGLAELHVNGDEVVLPNLHVEQFNALPDYGTTAIGAGTEMQIREIIGSPAALRIEETITELDQQSFYAHHHFGGEKIYSSSKTVEKNPLIRGI